MKAVILAGGHGQRLGELVREVPKPMLRVGKTPVLHCIVDQLREADAKDIIISVDRLADVIRQYFGDGTSFGVRINYFQSRDDLHTAGTVKALESDLSTEPFYVVYGDCYSNYRLDDLRQAHLMFRKKDPAILGTIGIWVREIDLHEAGIVSIDSQRRVIRLQEKPRPEEIFSNLVNTAHYFLEPAILDRIPGSKHSNFMTDVFPALVEEGLLYATKLQGWYRPYDTPKLFELARAASAD